MLFKAPAAQPNRLTSLKIDGGLMARSAGGTGNVMELYGATSVVIDGFSLTDRNYDGKIVLNSGTGQTGVDYFFKWTGGQIQTSTETASPFTVTGSQWRVEMDGVARVDPAGPNSLRAVGTAPSSPAGAFSQGLVSGKYIGPPNTSPGGVALAVQGVLACSPIMIGNSGVLDRIGINVTVLGEAGSVVRLGIYKDNGLGQPDYLILDAGTVPGDGSTGIKEITISQWVLPGRYWLAAVAQLCPTTGPTVRASTGSPLVFLPDTAANADNPGARNGFQQSSITGALPARWGTANTASATLRPIVRAA